MNKGYSRLIEDNLNEEATQVSNVDAGKVSVFGSDAGNKFKHNNWYEQLFELNDHTNVSNEFKVKQYNKENTGGNTIVAMGQFEDGTYFGLGDETLILFDEDYHEAYLTLEDTSDWQEEHKIKYYDYYDEEYNLVANQIPGFEIEEIDE